MPSKTSFTNRRKHSRKIKQGKGKALRDPGCINMDKEVVGEFFKKLAQATKSSHRLIFIHEFFINSFLPHYPLSEEIILVGSFKPYTFLIRKCPSPISLTIYIKMQKRMFCLWHTPSLNVFSKPVHKPPHPNHNDPQKIRVLVSIKALSSKTSSAQASLSRES